MSDTQPTSVPQNDELFIARQPIFDRDKNIWAYALAFQGAPESFSPLETNASTLDKIVSAGSEIMPPDSRASKALIPLCCDVLQACSQAHLLNGSHIVLLTAPATDPSAISPVATAIRKNGSWVALDSSMEPESFESLIQHVDILAMSMKNNSPSDVIAFKKRMKGFTGQLLITDVETWEDYQGTRALGFSFFQGAFFTRPFSLTEQTLNKASIAKIGLLRELNSTEIDMNRLADVIATDVSLSYRLLRYINSAAFGLAHRIKSIQQAVSLLGITEIRRWAMVVAMTDMDNTPKGEELAYMALQRARFLEQMATTLHGVKRPADQFFLLGLFSRLDALMGHDMDATLKDIPLDTDIREALCGKRGNDLGDALDMLDAVEKADWENANKLLLKYQACFTEAATQYLKASTWASRQMTDMG